MVVKMKFEEIMNWAGLCFVIAISFLIFCVLIFFLVVIGDVFTIEDVGIEKVPCVDNHGRPFEDELCDKPITCSWLGLARDNKCKVRIMPEFK